MEEPIEDPKSGPEERADILLSGKRVIDRASAYFSMVLELIDQRHKLGWPMTDILEISQEIDAEAIRVRDDFSQLYSRAKALLDMRIQSVQVEMSALNIRNQRKDFNRLSGSDH